MDFNGGNKRLHCMKKNTEINLPFELVIEILSWLPIKHLSPLRFVSKSWHQLLTKDPQFAKLQFDRSRKSNPNPSIIASKFGGSKVPNLFLATQVESCDKALTLGYPFYNPVSMSKYSLSGNCNGLLCFHRDDHKEVYIWNPIINDHITISCIPAPCVRFPGYRTCTGFGFGFDQDINLYKVVRFFNETRFTGVPTQISVYTIGVDFMWRTVQVDSQCHLAPTCRIIPLVNGVLHWNKSSLGTTSYDKIVTFDLKREVIDELPLPFGMKNNEIVELRGLFCVVDISDESEMHMWVMKEYGLVSSWSKQYIIGKPCGCFYHMVPLGFADKGEIIMDKHGFNLALYSSETNTVRNLNGFRSAVFLPYAYIGSIISPTVISRAGHNLL